MNWNPFKKKPARVGWVIDQSKAGVIWYPPEPLVIHSIQDDFYQSSLGQGLESLYARHFLVRCPYDLNISIVQKDGRWGIRSNAGNQYALSPSMLRKAVHITSPIQWRDPKKPLLQIATPYRFVTDDKVFFSQLPAFTHFKQTPLPGVFVSGRFPIDVWPRVLMWAIEIHDLQKPLILKRGEPWFIAKFEPAGVSTEVELVEAEITPELLNYSKEVDGVTSYVNQTFSLFKTGWQRRPKQLLKIRKK